MVVLKKIKASTLMETLVATVLIVVIFMISSMILNNLFANSILRRRDHVQERLHELKYQYSNGNLQIPYNDDMQDWEITVERNYNAEVAVIEFSAVNQKNQKSITEVLLSEN